MNKQAYFRMMGLTKRAADAPGKQTKTETSAPTPAAPAAGKDKTWQQLLNDYVPFEKRLTAINDVSKTSFDNPGMFEDKWTWKYIWNLIKSWFGNEEAKAYIDAVLKGEREAQKMQGRYYTALADGGKNKFEGLSEEQRNSLNNAVQSQLIHAVKRKHSARAKTQQAKKLLGQGVKLPSDEVFDNYFMGRGFQNTYGQPAPKNIEGLTEEQLKKIAPLGDDMALLKAPKGPSYMEQLGGSQYPTAYA